MRGRAEPDFCSAINVSIVQNKRPLSARSGKTKKRYQRKRHLGTTADKILTTGFDAKLQEYCGSGLWVICVSIENQQNAPSFDGNLEALVT